MVSGTFEGAKSALCCTMINTSGGNTTQFTFRQKRGTKFAENARLILSFQKSAILKIPFNILTAILIC